MPTPLRHDGTPITPGETLVDYLGNEWRLVAVMKGKPDFGKLAVRSTGDLGDRVLPGAAFPGVIMRLDLDELWHHAIPDPNQDPPMLTITIATEDDAFTDGNHAEEIARILGVIAGRIRDDVHDGIVMDRNGNVVGSYALSLPPAVADDDPGHPPGV